MKIGSFSAASNVTGIVSDTNAIATLLHEHGALSFWDFAAAGPYVDIEMYGSPGASSGVQGRHLSSARTSSIGARHPGCPRRPSRACDSQPGSRRPRRRHRGLRQPLRTPLPR